MTDERRAQTTARIAVIGAGTFGEMHLRAFKQMDRRDEARLVGVADINSELLSFRHSQYGMATFPDYREMIEKTNPDGVTIVTPDFLHCEIAAYCLEAGKHVLVEKPLDVTVEGCGHLINIAKACGRLLQVDFHKRYDPYHCELRDMVAHGTLGEVEYGYAHMEDRIEVPRDWFREWSAHTSPAWFLGVHMYDLIRWIVGSEAQSVCATGVKKKLLSLGIDTFDSIQAKLVLESGASFTVDTSWILPEGHEAVVNQGLRVVGSEGMMEVDTQDRGARGCLREPTDRRAQKGSGMQTWNAGFFRAATDGAGRTEYSGYGIESIQHFARNVNSLLEGGSLDGLAGTYPSGHDGLEATKIAVGIHRSVEAGGAVVPVHDGEPINRGAR